MPMPRRRAGLAIVVFSVLRFAFAAPDLPDCAVRCVTISSTFNCDIDHYTCICTNFANPVRDCIKNICPGPEGTQQSLQFELQCSNEGVQIPGGATGSSPIPSPSPSQPTSTPGGSSPPPSSTRSTTSPASTAGPSTPSSSHSSSTDTTPIPSGTVPSNPANQSGVNGSGQQPGSEDNGGGTSTGSLIGAIVGGLLGGLLVVALAFFILRRRRKEFIEDEDVRAFRVPHADDMSYHSNGVRDSKFPVGVDGSTSPSGHQYTNSGSDFLAGNSSPSARVSPVGLPAGVAVPFARGPSSVADSQGTYAPRPLIIGNDDHLPPRKGDPPRVPSFRGPGSSVVSESVAGSSSHRGDGDANIPDSASAYLSSSGAQDQLTPEQLNIVQTMVNRGLPGPAVVDVIQRMLSENQEVPPVYVAPEPGTNGQGGAAASGTSGSSTRLPYRRGSSNVS